MNKFIKEKIQRLFKYIFKEKNKIQFEDFQVFLEWEMGNSFNLLHQTNYSNPEKAMYMAGFITGRKSILDDITKILKD